MAKINHEIISTKWKNKRRLCFIACIGFLIGCSEQPVVLEPIQEEIVPAPVEYEITYIDPISYYSEEEMKCLILNSYYEARNQDPEAIIAVAMVTLNRYNDSRYPNNLCDVIKQSKYDVNGRLLLHQCQFSWYCDGKSDNPKDMRAYHRVQGITYYALELWYNGWDITNGATHYHANYVNPDWRYQLTYVTDIGDHKFYKWN